MRPNAIVRSAAAENRSAIQCNLAVLCENILTNQTLACPSVCSELTDSKIALNRPPDSS